MAVALKQPGQYRAFLGALIGAAFGFALVVVLREISGLPTFQTEPTGYPHVIVPAITAPFGYLIGLGCFDYWFRWAAGARTRPEDHSQHGAHSWRDYFKFNTDHKVIGIQYVVTSFIFFFVGGAFGLALVVVLREISGLPTFQTEPTGYPQVIVPAITAPFGFLIGLGCFD
ncbi:MAG: hypothetical protein ACRDL1_04910 [Solirubrobacterales bacterium]